MRLKSLTKETHEVLPYEGGGFAIYRKNGTTAPSATPKETTKTDDAPAKKKQEHYLLCPKCGHKSKTAEAGDLCENPKVKGGCTAFYGEDPAVPETYHRVRFANKGHENDTEDVILSVNGEVLTIMRDEEVIIPGRFKEAADHAQIQKFKKEPGKQRKKRAPVQTYPYSLIGDSTEKDYTDMKAEGKRASQAAAAVA